MTRRDVLKALLILPTLPVLSLLPAPQPGWTVDWYDPKATTMVFSFEVENNGEDFTVDANGQRVYQWVYRGLSQ